MKVKVSEASGPALDWMVAKCEGFTLFTDDISWIIHDAGKYRQLPHYSTDWAQGGPIIERERIGIEPWGGDAFWVAMTYSEAGMTLHKQFGPTPLIAAMRCYVASKLGDEVEVPDALTP